MNSQIKITCITKCMENSDKHSGFGGFFLLFLLSQRNSFTKPRGKDFPVIYNTLKYWRVLGIADCFITAFVNQSFQNDQWFPSPAEDTLKRFSDSGEYSLWEKAAPLKHLQLTINELRNPNQLALIHCYRWLQHKFPKIFRQATLTESMAVRQLHILWIWF